jgi:DNA-binding MarR family transcriptional regulator
MGVPSGNQAFSRTERAVLRCLAQQGGTVYDGYRAIAEATDRGLRSVERSVASLRASGFVDTRWRRRRPSHVLLTGRGNTVARELFSGLLPAATDEAEQPQRVSAHVQPQGFSGDANALNVARIVVQMRGSDTLFDLAHAYVEHASPAEMQRLHSYLDEHGFLATEANPTHYEPLDDGLRHYFTRRAKRARDRELVQSQIASSAFLSHRVDED